MRQLLGAFALLCASAVASAPVDTPILMIGASYENGKTPCVLNKVNVIGCLSVGFGQYLSLSQALSLNPLNAAIVINEAIGGATTSTYLLAENQGSDSIVVFGIDPETGQLTPTGHTAQVPSPVCIRMIRLGFSQR